MSKKNITDRLDAIEEHLGINTPKTTRILVIQDKSGSMYSRVEQTINGFNEYLEDLQRDESDEAYLTLVQFNTAYTVVHEDTPVAEVEALNSVTYRTGGGTALLDAVGRGLDTLEEQMNAGDRALVIIMTDGQENSSHEYTQSAIKSRIAKLERKGNYTFIFLGAGTGAWSGGEMLGLRRNQTVQYGEGAWDHGIAYKGLSGMTSGLRSGTSMASAAPGTITSEAMASQGADVNLEISTTVEEDAPLWVPGTEEKQKKDAE